MRNKWTAPIVALFVVTGCNGDATGPKTEPVLNVAVAEYVSDRPALFLQDASGTTRTQVHFNGAADEIAGNIPDLLPVTDGQLKAIGAMEWSPDGGRLAVVLTLAFDQSQVVVIDREGRGARTASPNTQIIMSDVAWSPDGGRIAYTMSTLPHAQGVDLFVTDLSTSRVTRVTTGGGLGAPGVALGWNATGDSVFVSRVTGTTGSGVAEDNVSRIDRISVSSGALTNVASGVIGTVQAIGGNGAFALTLRNAGVDGVETQRRLYREDIASHTATGLTAAMPLHWADLTAGGNRIIVGENTGSGGTVSLRYQVLSATGSVVTTLRGIESGTAVVEVYY
jgi:dipeptidyl aminopeptidase/acylaminoacyl peptidase